MRDEFLENPAIFRNLNFVRESLTEFVIEFPKLRVCRKRLRGFLMGCTGKYPKAKNTTRIKKPKRKISHACKYPATENTPRRTISQSAKFPTSMNMYKVSATH